MTSLYTSLYDMIDPVNNQGPEKDTSQLHKMTVDRPIEHGGLLPLRLNLSR